MKPINLESKTLLKLSIAATFLVVFFSAVYATLGILEKAPSSWPIFIILLTVVNIFNGVSAFLVRKNWPDLSFGRQAVSLLWFLVSFWYWTIGPFYYFLTMQLDKAQFTWVPFAYLWEVPIIGGFVFVLAAYLLLRPIKNYFEGASYPRDGQALYAKTLRYPIILGVLIFLVAVVGYFIGALQVAVFAGFPVIEQVKNVLNGMAVTLFLGGVLYLVFDSFLDQVRAKLEHDYPIKDGIRSWTGKVFGITVIFAIGTMALIALMAFNFFQNVVVNSITYELREEVEIIPGMIADANPKTKADILRVFQKGENGALIFLEENNSFPNGLISEESREDLLNSESGVIHDLQDEAKLVAFFKDPQTGDTIISIVYISDFFPALRIVSGLGVVGAAMLILITFGFAAFISYALTASIRRITSTIRRNRESGKTERMHIHSGDELEELSNEIEKVIQLDEAKSNFVSMTSHHLRTPLVGIRWSASRILRKMDPKKDVREHVKDIESSAEDLAELVNTLLSVSRIESGSVGINPEEIDIIKFIKDTVGEKQGKASKAKDIKISFEPSQKPIYAYIDRAAITILFETIITNAIEYTPEGGSVNIKLYKEDSVFVLKVADTGIGIPEDEQSKIFSKMARASNAQLHKAEGLGLGLYMAKKIAVLLGGMIWFESQEGKGSTFYVELPLEIKEKRDGKPLALEE